MAFLPTLIIYLETHGCDNIIPAALSFIIKHSPLLDLILHCHSYILRCQMLLHVAQLQHANPIMH